MPHRLGEDHANARFLAGELAKRPGIQIDPASVQTNIVIFRLRGKDGASGGDAAAFTAALKQKGVLISIIGPHSVRFVTHYDVDRAACQKAAAIVTEQLQSL